MNRVPGGCDAAVREGGKGKLVAFSRKKARRWLGLLKTCKNTTTLQVRPRIVTTEARLTYIASKLQVHCGVCAG